MANKHERVVDLQEAPNDFLSRAYRSIQRLGWNIRSTNPQGIEASVPTSIWSWGERISVTVQPDGRGLVRSASALPTQFIDWGRNRKNVELLLKTMDNI